jgi:hypothetical protein
MRLVIGTPGLALRLGRQARRRAVERYSMQRNLDALLDVYEGLRAGGPAVRRPAAAAVVLGLLAAGRWL